MWSLFSSPAIGLLPSSSVSERASYSHDGADSRTPTQRATPWARCRHIPPAARATGNEGRRQPEGSRRLRYPRKARLGGGMRADPLSNARVSSSVGGVRHRAPCSRETRYSGLIGHDAGRPTTAPVALLASCECVGDVGSGTCSVACAVLRDGASLRSGVGARATRERRQATAPRLRRRRVMLAAAFSEEVVQCPRNPSYRLRSTTGQRTR
jgi:hypothetical protein